MEKKQFDALLPLIVAAVVQKIIDRQQISQDDAIQKLYQSQLYTLLDDESTKVWYYSAEKLYSLFDEELQSGSLKLPDC
ncbi:MAG: hypothetical protein LBS97_04290 [Treponema sp.]|jgi:hypothetical protein|nr:hypothetical protein [Treponema sp.]